jgi:serine/threonine protein kinase
MKREINFKGKGRFGKVLEIQDCTGKNVAFKIIKPENLNLIEIDILSRVKSPFLIRSVGEIKTNSGYEGISMELKENNLSNLTTKSIAHGQIKRIIMSLVYGLECLHKSGFLHLDLKPNNCLYDYVNGMYTGYISDFGFSLRCHDCYKGIERKSRAGSVKYFPYEILTKSDKYIFDDKSDVWSMGLTILIFLGFSYSFNFNLEQTTEEKIEIIKNFWDENPIEKIIIETVEKNDFSELDKIDLIEMITFMLKKDKNQRISSKDFIKLRFYKNNSFENSCYVSKPKEILYIPYSSVNVIKGINNLNYFFKNRYPKAKLEVYFLSMEIFIRLMALTPMEISNQTLESHIQKSFVASMKYYREVSIDVKNLKIFKELGYDIANFLKGDIAPNRYFYKAKFPEDLVLLKEILFTNYNLICLYSYLDTEKLFNYFRQNYKYEDEIKKDLIYFEDLEEFPKPDKNTTMAIENDRSIFSYKNLDTRQEFYQENVSEINTIRIVEEIFRKKLEEAFRSKIKENIVIGDIFKFYTNNFKEKDISITDLFSKKSFQDIIPTSINISYGRIKEDIFDRLETSQNLEEKHIIFKSMRGDYSLLVRSDNDDEIIHYFSDFNENLHDYFRKNEPKTIYKNNKVLKTNSVCKINELCFIFLIYYNNRVSQKTYNLIYLEDITLELMLKIFYSFI